MTLSRLIISTALALMSLASAAHSRDILLGCTGLRQHRSCGLVEDLQLSQLRGLKCKVRILNPASGHRQVGRDVRKVIHRVAQAIGNGPELRALDVHRFCCSVDLGRCSPGAAP